MLLQPFSQRVIHLGLPTISALSECLDHFSIETHGQLFFFPTTNRPTTSLAAAKTGLSDKAIRRKIEDGIWIEQRQWRRAPDNHIMIDMEGVQAWVEKAAESKSAKAA